MPNRASNSLILSFKIWWLLVWNHYKQLSAQRSSDEVEIRYSKFTVYPYEILLHTDSQIFDQYSAMKTCIFTDSHTEVDTQQISLMNTWYKFLIHSFYFIICNPNKHREGNQYGHSTCGKLGKEFYPFPEMITQINGWLIDQHG